MSQIKVETIQTPNLIGKVKTGGIYLLASLEYVLDEQKDTVYTFNYRNLEYDKITVYHSFTFNNEGNTLDEFYNLLKTFFTDENKKNKDYKLSIKLSETPLILSNFRTMGVTSVMIYLGSGKGYVYLTERQVDKVFGKLDNDKD
jgi:hypothetical protein